MSDASEIIFEKNGAAGIITLNRPKALNALTHNMCVQMKHFLDLWKDDPAIKAVIVKGAGDKAFCAGGDIRALYESGLSRTPYAMNFYHDEYVLNAAIKRFPKPYIALMKGIVMGGGVGVSVHGSHRIAEDTTLFAMPETGIGLFPDVGGSFFLPRCPGQIGMYLALTGARLRTADTLYANIATHYIPSTKWDDLILRVANGEQADDVIADLCEASFSSPLAENHQIIDLAFSEKSVEDIIQRLKTASSEWAFEVAKTLLSKSPTSLKVTFQQIRLGANLDFEDCMRMEYRMAHKIMLGKDLYEGIRATIIDKTGAPQWSPAHLHEVSDDAVNAHFKPLGDKELSL